LGWSTNPNIYTVLIDFVGVRKLTPNVRGLSVAVVQMSPTSNCYWFAKTAKKSKNVPRPKWCRHWQTNLMQRGLLCIAKPLRFMVCVVNVLPR
jgi:hypothetical protein